MAAPCAARHKISQPICGASAAPMLAANSSVRLHKSTGRRPKRSASGPQASCDKPKARISADIVSCVAFIGAPSSRASSGSAGKYRSVTTGCKPSSKVSASAAVWGGTIGERAVLALACEPSGAAVTSFIG